MRVKKHIFSCCNFKTQIVEHKMFIAFFVAKKSLEFDSHVTGQSVLKIQPTCNMEVFVFSRFQRFSCFSRSWQISRFFCHISKRESLKERDIYICARANFYRRRQQDCRKTWLCATFVKLLHSSSLYTSLSYLFIYSVYLFFDVKKQQRSVTCHRHKKRLIGRSDI